MLVSPKLFEVSLTNFQQTTGAEHPKISGAIWKRGVDCGAWKAVVLVQNPPLLLLLQEEASARAAQHRTCRSHPNLGYAEGMRTRRELHKGPLTVF